MRIDLHTHTLLSDGDLLPIELARRADVKGIKGIAFTDHVSLSTIDRVIEETAKDCQLAESWDIETVLGVEITHVPANRIDDLVSRARRLGAELVVVHGESLAEPTEPGTNLMAVKNPEVDILAHPGLITIEEAQLAKDNSITLEISSRRGHCLTNGHVALRALEVGAGMVVNTDAHSYSDLITQERAELVAKGAGLSENEVKRAVIDNPQEILRRIRGR
ncbi:MAG: histidinol phosphate phosphatase domain-containing protein [Methanomassiliicoccales archaeon]|nr:histidinol phosphate phosphatase domain-containing protein [Methanomassiliicoccales archaeon]NYT14563.1 histidinol phosphate phosphatase domain-containing protein [Methanomassiliicoccales archaeon]